MPSNLSLSPSSQSSSISKCDQVGTILISQDPNATETEGIESQPEHASLLGAFLNIRRAPLDHEEPAPPPLGWMPGFAPNPLFASWTPEAAVRIRSELATRNGDEVFTWLPSASHLMDVLRSRGVKAQGLASDHDQAEVKKCGASCPLYKPSGGSRLLLEQHLNLGALHSAGSQVSVLAWSLSVQALHFSH